MKFLARIFVLLSGLLILAPSAKTGTVGSGSQTCPTSGNKRVSSSNIFATYVSIQAPIGNTGTVFVGGSTVTTSQGNGILALGTVGFAPHANAAVFNLNQIYFACSVSADSVYYLYIQ